MFDDFKTTKCIALHIGRLLAIAGLAFAAGLAPAASPSAKSVLAIFANERLTPADMAIDKAFNERLGLAPGIEIAYFAEFLDNARFPGEDQEKRFASFLRDRYAATKIDVILAVGPASAKFLARHRADLFPGVPVVLAAVSSASLQTLALPPGFVGVPANFDASLTIDLALRLQPRARELVIVTGTALLDREWDRRLRVLSRTYEPRLKVRFLAGLGIDATATELAALSPDSIVLIPSYRRDGAGLAFIGVAGATRHLAKRSAAPIYGVYSTVVGEGAVGTNSLVIGEIGAQAAGIARRVLDGENPDSMILPDPLRPRTIVDARELKRWGIDEALLPPGSTVLFHEDTFWQQYRLHVFAVALLVLLETGLVAGLLIQRNRRRRVEARLRDSERTMHLAARSAQLVMWNWDIVRDEVWISYASQRVKRVTPAGRLGFERILERIHPADRETVRKAANRALDDEAIYECEYRVATAEGRTRWYAARGRVERVHGKARWLRGVTLDITRRKEAELDAQVQRSELTHLTRVSLLGELSGSMAHELNQPLMAILSNAQAARMFIGREPIDLVELGAILDDIVENDKRAGEIIWGMRKMLKKEYLEYEPLAINDLVQEVLRLMRSELVNRNVTVDARLAANVRPIRGDPTQLQQVILNLVMNACDAMASLPRHERVLEVRTEAAEGGVRVVVSDRGSGIPAETLAGIFMPFVTTKKHGLGLGLAVCNSIIASHGGEIKAANNADRGAAFTFFLHAEAETETVQ